MRCALEAEGCVYRCSEVRRLTVRPSQVKLWCGAQRNRFRPSARRCRRSQRRRTLHPKRYGHDECGHGIHGDGSRQRELTGSVPVPTLAFIKNVDYLVADESRARWLLLQVHPSPADPFRFEIDGYLDAVSNLDERNAAVHPELFAIEGHCSIDRINACPLAGKRQRQPLLLGYSPYREVAVKCNRVGTGLFDFCGVKRDQRIVFDIEEIFAFQLAVFHSVSGIHGSSLDLNVQNACRKFGRRER